MKTAKAHNAPLTGERDLPKETKRVCTCPASNWKAEDVLLKYDANHPGQWGYWCNKCNVMRWFDLRKQ
jgi:hypothetical protein